MNWFKRHKNWTWIIGIIAVYGLEFIIGFIAGLSGASETVLLIVEYSTAAIGTIAVTVWYLKAKNRSQWNNLWLIVPFGGIVLLCLSDKYLTNQA